MGRKRTTPKPIQTSHFFTIGDRRIEARSHPSADPNLTIVQFWESGKCLAVWKEAMTTQEMIRYFKEEVRRGYFAGVGDYPKE